MKQHHIYVAQGAAGLLKVGKSSDPQARRNALHKEFKARGDQLRRFESVPICTYGYYEEDNLIAALASREPRAGGREWFSCGHFENAVRAAREIAEHYADPSAEAGYANRKPVHRRHETSEEAHARQSACMKAVWARRKQRSKVIAWVIDQLGAAPSITETEGA